ncbi:hypothetical protein [Secundilactobacillus kimchicus]|uniref:hypothetical protein n=1 Tax=Secundilactobacillus kimchicus TaxID=528209 RepID=UPI0006D092F3|nr:hypothetical protein [Secundilactobacillus kimchicus]
MTHKGLFLVSLGATLILGSVPVHAKEAADSQIRVSVAPKSDRTTDYHAVSFAAWHVSGKPTSSDDEGQVYHFSTQIIFPDAGPATPVSTENIKLSQGEMVTFSTDPTQFEIRSAQTIFFGARH